MGWRASALGKVEELTQVPEGRPSSHAHSEALLAAPPKIKCNIEFFRSRLDGVRDIVVSRAWRRALRRRDGAVRLTATPHGNDTGAHHFHCLLYTSPSP